MKDNSVKVRTFEDLEVWKLTRKLRNDIYEVSKYFPKEEKYCLTSQTRDASVSVTANLAEGYGRFHFQENIQFCRISRGSLYETIDHLITAYDQQYLDDTRFYELKNEAYRCVKVLNSYIASLKRLKADPNNLITK